MSQANDPKTEKRKGLLGWSWTGFDLLLVLGALIVGSLIWFIPAFWDTPELRAFYEKQKVLKAQRLAVEAEDARIKKENDDLGLVYIAPGTNPFPTRPPASAAKPAPKKPAKTPAKPVEKKDN